MVNIELVKQTWNKNDIDELYKYLKDISEEGYKQFHSKLIPGCDNILGIRLPKLREIAKQICKGNYKQFLDNADDKYYESTMIQGLIIGYCKADLDVKMKMLELYVPRMNNWAVVDSVSSNLKIVQKHREEFLKLLQQYIKSNKEFEVRFAVVVLMDFYITDEYIDYVLDVLKSINRDEYYIKMAVAWAFSFCFIKFKDKTLKVLLSGDIEKDTLRKSFQKIVESNRVDKETKVKIKEYRKTMC